MATAVNIREFPEGYVGRKTYVLIANHGFVAACYTYRSGDGKSHLLPEYGGDCSGMDARSNSVKAPQIMKSIGAYRSPVDGSVIASRADHRDHLKRHSLIEVGNEPIGNMSRPQTDTKSDKEFGQRVKHHLETVRAMPQKQYNQIVEAKVNTP